MSRHARAAKPLSQPPPTVLPGRGRHAASAEPAAPAAAQSPGHGARRSRARRRSHGPARAVLAVCCTALAAGTGGVLSGVLPMPPGLPKTVVVAGDPAAARTVAADPESPADDAAAAPQAPPIPMPSAPTATPTPTRPAHAGGHIKKSPTPSATPSASKSAKATPTATPTPKAPTADRTTAPPPPPTSTVTAADGSDGSTAAMAATVLTLVNQQRATAGCKPLVTDAPLAGLATDFSYEMAARGFFDHTDPDGKTPWDRASADGISYLGGENIAMGQQTPQDVMDAWMNSPGHRANILNCDYTKLGVGVHLGTGGPWWTQDFGF